MTSPETIPEDKYQAFPCDCGGNIKHGQDGWFCDSCDWQPADTAREFAAKVTLPGFEDIDLAPWADELLAEGAAGNHTATILYGIADKVTKGEAVHIGEAAFLLGYIKAQQALRADLPEQPNNTKSLAIQHPEK